MILTHEQAVEFFSKLYGGVHRIPGARYKWENVRPYVVKGCWQVSHAGDIATYDYDQLTRLVFLAHEMCIRAGITPCGPRHIRIYITARERVDSYTQGHPTLAEAMDKLREQLG